MPAGINNIWFFGNNSLKNSRIIINTLPNNGDYIYFFNSINSIVTFG